MSFAFAFFLALFDGPRFQPDIIYPTPRSPGGVSTLKEQP